MGLIAQATLALSLGAAMAGAETRFAVMYAPGKMESVAVYRAMSVEDCMLAHPTLGLGAWVYVEGAETHVRRRCRVTDVSAPADRARHIRTKLIELDFESARAICPVGWDGARRECQVLVR